MANHITTDNQPPATPAANDRSWARPLFERQVAMLGELAEAGLEIALTLKDQVKSAPEADRAEAGANAYMAYARVARAVRMSILLQADLIKRLQDWDRHAAYLASSAVAGQAQAREDLADQRKARVEAIVERVARRQTDRVETVERLVGEAAERLDQDDLYGDVLARPLSELVALICRDLGLDPDWPRLAQEAWAVEEASSGAVGWPLANPTDRRFDAVGVGPPNAGRSNDDFVSTSPALTLTGKPTRGA